MGDEPEVEEKSTNPFSTGNFKVLKDLINEAVRSPDNVDKVAKRITYLFGEGVKPPQDLKTKYIPYTNFTTREDFTYKKIIDSVNKPEGGLPPGGIECQSGITIDYTFTGGTLYSKVRASKITDSYTLSIEIAPSGGTVGDISSDTVSGSSYGSSEVFLDVTGETSQYHYYFRYTDDLTSCVYEKTDSIGGILISEGMPLSVDLTLNELMPVTPLSQSLPPA